MKNFNIMLNLARLLFAAVLIFFIYLLVTPFMSPTHEYIVRLHYLDGFEKTVIYKDNEDPSVSANKGTYYFTARGIHELGVIRIDVLNKRKLEPNEQ